MAVSMQTVFESLDGNELVKRQYIADNRARHEDLKKQPWNMQEGKKGPQQKNKGGNAPPNNRSPKK
jgi:hypothetical protein